jgi:hypothetical protein
MTKGNLRMVKDRPVHGDWRGDENKGEQSVETCTKSHIASAGSIQFFTSNESVDLQEYSTADNFMRR